MEFENQFSVKAPIDDVWRVLLDVERVAPCLPGARVQEHTGEDEYVVGMRVKVGPIAMEYKGNVRIVERDDATHRAVLNGSGREVRGQGAAEATAEMVLTQDGDATVARIKTDVKLSGRMASMGQGVIADVSRRLIDTFSANLQAMMAPAPVAVAAPLEAGGHGTVASVATVAPGPVTPARASTPPAPPDDASLPLMSIAGAVLVSRLRNPRVAIPVAIVVLGVAALVYRLVRR